MQKREHKYSGTRLKRPPYDEKPLYIMHKQLVTDSFLSLVEQKYLPIVKSHNKTSGVERTSMLQNTALTFSANNE